MTSNTSEKDKNIDKKIAPAGTGSSASGSSSTEGVGATRVRPLSESETAVREVRAQKIAALLSKRQSEDTSTKTAECGGGGFLGKCNNGGLLQGLPIKDRDAEKIVEEVEDKNSGSGGWFGYALQIKEVQEKKGITKGEQIARKIKEAGQSVIEKLDPGIIASDFRAMSAAVFQAAIQSKNHLLEKDRGMNAPLVPLASVEALTFEAQMEMRNDNIKAVSRIVWPVYDQTERERRKESVKSVGDIPFVKTVILPSNSFHGIAQNLSAAVSLRAETMENYSKILDLRSRKVLLLARIAAMEGETYTSKLYTDMAERVRIFDTTVFIKSTYRGREE